MRDLFKRILGRQPVGDIAIDDWTPVPATAVRVDWAGYLGQGEVSGPTHQRDVSGLVAEMLDDDAVTLIDEPRSLASESPSSPQAADTERCEEPDLEALSAVSAWIAAGEALAEPSTESASDGESASDTESGGYLAYLSAEERAIIQEQNHTGPQQVLAEPETPEPAATQPEVVAATQAPEVVAQPQPVSRRDRPAAKTQKPAALSTKPATLSNKPAAKSKRKPASRSWTDVLKEYGEHLTDEELLIIRAQLA